MNAMTYGVDGNGVILANLDTNPPSDTLECYMLAMSYDLDWVMNPNQLCSGVERYQITSIPVHQGACLKETVHSESSP
ncbi:hypothetical protein V6N13_137779 [Hibiscus sabdariffa]|uniref:Uncharacterized protein n=1 Tax=Hibiscus sabdariffa TaxID=183260 RepID=A0ABR2DJL7_9ROSI